MNPAIDELLYKQLSNYIMSIYNCIAVQSIDLVIEKDCIYFKLLCSNNMTSFVRANLQTLRNESKELDDLVRNFINLIEL